MIHKKSIVSNTHRIAIKMKFEFRTSIFALSEKKFTVTSWTKFVPSSMGFNSTRAKAITRCRRKD